MKYILVKPPKIRSLDVKKSEDGKKVKLVCRTKRTQNLAKLSWSKDGEEIKITEDIKIKNKR